MMSRFLEATFNGQLWFHAELDGSETSELKIRNQPHMKTSIPIIQAALITASFLLCPSLALAVGGEVGPNYVVFKNVRSIQTAPGTFSLGNNPYRLSALVQAASNLSITGGTLDLPGGSSASSPKALVLQNDGVINDGTYAFQQTFADQATLDSNYADGTYGVHVTGASAATYNASLSLTGDVYPSSTPNITNTNWISGNLVVDPAASFTVTWGAFTGGTASDRIGVGVGRIQDATATFQVLPSTATSVTFPAGFFQSDDSYRIHIVFLKVTATDTTDISGSTGFAGYGKATRVTIQTTGSNSGNPTNISTRGFVESSNNILIAGIIIKDADKKIIVRAIGPELTPYGIANALADPTLALFDSTNALIATNNDWQTTQIGGIITSSQVTEIQNSGFAPTSSSESAIIATLPPGNYTAFVQGANATTGVALVEVYVLP
jgi:hypothetical protein